MFCGWVLPLPGAFAERRFPPPDFEGGYTQPALTFQEYTLGWMEYFDVLLLLALLLLTAWLLHSRRTRVGIYLVSLFSLLYFGFYKHGCICSIGAIQNVSLSLLDSTAPISVPVIAVFILPIILSLYFGRVYCGAVCPLGAIQDLFIFKPLRVPFWLDAPLSLLKYLYLGLAVYAVTNYNRFVICEYDPFVSLFRFDGPFWKFSLGFIFLVVGLVIARPYCRYFCPYGAILALFSRWTSQGVRITPTDCTNCTLCDAMCPFGAIRRPEEIPPLTPAFRGTLLLISLLLLILVSITGTIILGYTLSGFLLSFWFGVVIAISISSLAFRNQLKTYETDNANCLSCGRCFKWCPYGREIQPDAEISRV
jgi:polyferredoxin